MSASKISTWIVLSAGLLVAFSADSQAAERTDGEVAIWEWDAAQDSNWRLLMKVKTSDLAERTVQRLSEKNGQLGKTYRATNGAPPADQPEIVTPQGVIRRVSSHRSSPPKRTTTRSEKADSGIEPAASSPTPRTPQIQTSAPEFGLLPHQVGGSDAKLAASGLTVLASPTHDFGRVRQGVAVKHVFRIKNSGKTPVTLELVERSCGCTTVKFNNKEMQLEDDGLSAPTLTPVPEFSSAPPLKGLNESEQLIPVAEPESARETKKAGHVLKPGATARVEISVANDRGPGPFQQRVTLATNAGDSSAVTLEVTGVSVPLIELSESSLDFGDVPANEESRLEIDLSSDLAESFDIVRVESTNSDVKLEYQSLSAEELKERQLKHGHRLFAVLQSSAAIGEIQGEIVVETNLEGQPSVRIPLSGAVSSDAVTFPADRFELGLIATDAGVKRGTHLRVAAAEEISVEAVSADPDQLTVRAITARGNDGNSYVILEVELLAGLSPGLYQSSVEVRTNLNSAPRIRIPVSGWVMDQSLAFGEQGELPLAPISLPEGVPVP